MWPRRVVGERRGGSFPWKFGGQFVEVRAPINCKKMLLTFWKVKQQGRRSSNKKSSNTQQNQEQSTRNNNPETVRAVRRNGVPRRVPEEGWGLSRVGTRKVGGAEGWGAQNFAFFFFLLPPPCSFFFSLSGCLLVSFFLSPGVFSWNFGGVLVSWDLKCACFRPPGHPQHNRLVSRKVVSRRLGPEPGKSGAPKGGGPKISRFFILSCHYFHSFFLFRGSFRGIGGLKAGRVKPHFGRSGGGGSGGWSRESAQVMDTPTKILNTHRTDTTQHKGGSRTGLGQGGSLARWSMAQKTKHEQQIVPKSSPIGQGFQRTGLGKKRFQKWCGPNVVRKTQKTWKNK